MPVPIKLVLFVVVIVAVGLVVHALARNYWLAVILIGTATGTVCAGAFVLMHGLSASVIANLPISFGGGVMLSGPPALLLGLPFLLLRRRNAGHLLPPVR